MVFDVVGTGKDLFAADFSICMHDAVVGTMNLKGALGSRACTWQGMFLDTSFSLTYSRTTDRFLLEKYDPDFKNGVLRRDSENKPY